MKFDQACGLELGDHPILVHVQALGGGGAAVDLPAQAERGAGVAGQTSELAPKGVQKGRPKHALFFLKDDTPWALLAWPWP